MKGYDLPSMFNNSKMNACSLEHVPGQASSYVVGTYELDETTNLRMGHVEIHTLSSSGTPPSISPHLLTSPDNSGFLDCKFGKVAATTTLLAGARANGSISLHMLTCPTPTHTTPNFSYITSSDPSPTDPPGLCLSLDFDKLEFKKRIASSYSNGYIQIHSISSSLSSSPAPAPTLTLTPTTKIFAHSLFGVPAEVWSTCFAPPTFHSDFLLSGGDDSFLKGWDVTASLQKPAFKVGDEEFSAGVTAMEWNPSNPNLFAVGSYDESVRIYDARNLKVVLAKQRVEGGGIWRLRWDERGEKLLVGAMHAGGRVMSFNETEKTLLTEKEFTSHESMCYGADWLSPGVAGTCSFYDRKVCVWDAS